MILARALYLLAPLLVAAALSGLVLRLDLVPALKRPIHARLFGGSKTWRGVVTAIVGATLGVLAQTYVIPPNRLDVIDYRHTNAILLGLALGVGATAGELPNSFVKRRLKIPPGGTAKGALGVLFWCWDQIDLLTITWPLLLLFVTPPFELVAATFAIALVLHPLVALIGWLVGARKSWR